MVEEATGLIYISVRPNLLRPLNACGMVLRSSLTIDDAASEYLIVLLVLLAHQPDTSYQAKQIRYDSRQQRM